VGKKIAAAAKERPDEYFPSKEFAEYDWPKES